MMHLLLGYFIVSRLQHKSIVWIAMKPLTFRDIIEKPVEMHGDWAG
jgi:hypothetical protein